MSLPTVAAPYVDPGADALLAAALVPRRALFLDRDGVVNVDHAYVHRPEDTTWVPGIFALVAAATAAGFLPIVVTNQAGIARGLYDEAAFRHYTAWMHAEFARRGAPLLATYHCPHHPTAGLGVLRVACGCRKPEPGMLLRAITEWHITPQGSCLLGDKPSDLAAAHAAGVQHAWQVDDCVLPTLDDMLRAMAPGAG
jgi:D-glycero-D-manno-heptose 1,7-bisphosphate phosphatase